MPRKKKHENGYNKSPEGIAYRGEYRRNHYATITLDVPPEFKESLDSAAKERGLSRTKLVIEAVTAYMEAASESRRKEIKMKTYYILRDLSGYGSEYPICVDREEAERLVREWECGDFDEIWCEASENDIAKYGRYDTIEQDG